MESHDGYTEACLRGQSAAYGGMDRQPLKLHEKNHKSASLLHFPVCANSNSICEYVINFNRC